MQTEAIFENIAERIKFELKGAQKSIHIAVAWFTNKGLFNVLLEKAQGGCEIRLIISDDDINTNSLIPFDFLNSNNSKVYRVGNRNTALMHNKFCIIDYNTIISGSYNWSYKAENNFENIIITKNDTILAEQFENEFNNIIGKYFPNEKVKEIAFPLAKIIRRLEILKNYILLEDIEDIKQVTEKLKEFDFNNEINEIIISLQNKEYSTVFNLIQNFVSKNKQISIWTDPELVALKLEIKTLEIQLNAFDDEKSEIEKTISNFQHKHSKELGEIILEILRLKKLKFQNDKYKYANAEKDEEEYKNHVKSEKEKEVFELTPEEKLELKKKFRKATVLCHPDKVADEFCIEAHMVFIDLKMAYDSNNLKKVTEILQNLENGTFFKLKSDTVTEKEKLKDAIIDLLRKIKIIESQIISIKESETFKTICSIDDWDSYFSKLKEKLLIELEKLKIDLNENNEKQEWINYFINNELIFKVTVSILYPFTLEEIELYSGQIIRGIPNIFPYYDEDDIIHPFENETFIEYHHGISNNTKIDWRDPEIGEIIELGASATFFDHFENEYNITFPITVEAIMEIEKRIQFINEGDFYDNFEKIPKPYKNDGINYEYADFDILNIVKSKITLSEFKNLYGKHFSKFIFCNPLLWDYTLKEILDKDTVRKIFDSLPVNDLELMSL